MKKKTLGKKTLGWNIAEEKYEAFINFCNDTFISPRKYGEIVELWIELTLCNEQIQKKVIAVGQSARSQKLQIEVSKRISSVAKCNK